MQLRAGDHDGAIATAREALEREPGSLSARTTLAIAWLTHPDAARRDRSRAIEVLEAGLARPSLTTEERVALERTLGFARGGSPAPSAD